jgi:hypothetical protein
VHFLFLKHFRRLAYAGAMSAQADTGPQALFYSTIPQSFAFSFQEDNSR